MSHQFLFEKINRRIVLDREEGDIAYFNALVLKLEYLTKIVTAGMVACIGEDTDRHRYSLEYKLVRANSLGDWVEGLNQALVGAAAQFLIPDARNLARDLTEQVRADDWRYSAVHCLKQVADNVNVKVSIGQKVALRQFFDISVQIRNGTRGHGATTATQCSKSCSKLNKALGVVVDNMNIFALPWVHLHQNQSNKYRVLPILNDPRCFDYLKRTRDVRIPNGIYLNLDAKHSNANPINVPLVFYDSDSEDISLPNGNYKDRASEFEVISYVTNNRQIMDGFSWSNSPSYLPPSETEGSSSLELLNNTFGNVPPNPTDYIPRPDLEKQLLNELLTVDRHPIVTLTGPGGIGKTTIALIAIHKISENDPAPYDVILWISARDIDLLDSGPKPVSRNVFTQRDISKAVVQLLEPKEIDHTDFNSEKFFQTCLRKGADSCSTLFVLDNFETLKNPTDVFNWIDTHIRPPNKVLITTRFRSFAGDYPIEITGMLDDEANELVDQHASRLEITKYMNKDYVNALIRESDGHPYVIKILLGQVAKEKRAVKPKRIVASADDLLNVLFKRTYDALSHSSQRIFLLLCSWRVFVPEISVEAVLLRPENERFNVEEAIEELSRFSLVERRYSSEDNTAFLGVSLPAAMYGQRELDISLYKDSIHEDRKLLMEFGAGKKGDIQRGVQPRIENLVKAVALRASNSSIELEKSLPILEYLASRIPRTYLQLADLILEVDDRIKSKEQAKSYIRSFLHSAEVHEQNRAWIKLAQLCQSTRDFKGEIHAICSAALLPTSNHEDIGQSVNYLNLRIREIKKFKHEIIQLPIVLDILGQVIRKMENDLNKHSATDCSRLAWLYLNIGNSERALDIVKRGIEREPTNEYCLRLISRLESR